MRLGISPPVRVGAFMVALAAALLACPPGRRLEGPGDSGPHDVTATDDGSSERSEADDAPLPRDGDDAHDGDDGHDDGDATDDAEDVTPPDLCEDPPVGPVAFGTPCLEDTDCEPGLVCWTETVDVFDGLEYYRWPGGYCVAWGWEDAGCDPGDPGACGRGAVCAYLGTAPPPEGRRAYGCLDACDPLTSDGRPHADNCDCRTGYECTLGLGLCTQGCSNSRECCEIWVDGEGGPADDVRQWDEVVLLPPEVCSNRCDPATWRCGNEGCAGGDCAFGDPCNHDTDCPAGNWCRFLAPAGHAAPGGVCTLDACDAPGRACPGGTVCADLWEFAPLGGFSCVASCTPRVPPVESGCPATLSCHELLDPSGTPVVGCLLPCTPSEPGACPPGMACGLVSGGCLDGAATDADGDTISDLHENDVDTDADGIPDRFDRDSDSDGLPDAEEAGDADLATPPANCDGDTLPNHRDTDSDNDCLRDLDEVALHDSDPCLLDTDGDGADDLIEVSCGSDPRDPTENPLRRGDIIFLEPYLDAPRPADATIVFSTSLQRADVYFLLDTSASMTAERAAFRDSVLGIIIPGVRAAIPDSWFGLGRFSDFPLAPYGASGDEAYANGVPMTSDPAAVRAAADSFAAQDGGDEPDAQVPALYTLATGRNDHVCPRPALPFCVTGGYPCFRTGAVPLVVLITDSTFHSGPGETDPYGMLDTGDCAAFRTTYEDARAALVAGGVRVLGIEAGGSAAARTQLEQLVADTGAVTTSGPIVREVPDTGVGLGAAVIQAVEDYSRDVSGDVRLVAIDDPADGADAVAGFLDTLEPDPSGASVWDPATATSRICTVLPPADGDGDTLADSYPSVLPGTSVCFRLRPRMNTTMPPERAPQIFRVTLEARSSRDVPLDSRDVFFLVPSWGFCGGYPGDG